MSLSDSENTSLSNIEDYLERITWMLSKILDLVISNSGDQVELTDVGNEK